ncbi:MAG TPA: glycosyltransferase [Armatimonadota bacterium]
MIKHLERAGVECWLLHVLGHVDRSRFQMNLAVRDLERTPLVDEFEALGCEVYSLARRPGRPTFAGALRDIVFGSGPYDIVHCHNQFNRGYVLKLAKRFGIPVRVAHSHNAPVGNTTTMRRIRVASRNRYLARLWNAGIACSMPAAQELFGDSWRENPRIRLVYCGIDIEPFRAARPDIAVRAELGIPADAFVVGHVGRFVYQKNHGYLIDIAAEACRRRDNLRFLLLGDGDMKHDMMDRVSDRGLSDRVIFLGQRADAPRLIAGAMDAFCLPSLYEGLPLVGMEAQAAGLPMLVSDTITSEMDAVPQLVRRLSIQLSAADWAGDLLEMAANKPAITRSQAFEAMQAGPFNIDNSVASLQAFYEERLAQSARALPR